MIINTFAGNYINVGFSDLMRGSIALDFLCRKYNKSHKISWRSKNNNIDKMYIDYCNDAPFFLPEEQCQIFAFARDTIHHLDKLVQEHDNNTIKYIFCNLNTYTDSHAPIAVPFLRKYTTPSKYIDDITQDYIQKYNLEDFEVIHFRSCDQYTSPQPQHINIIQNAKHTKKVLFISSNDKIKSIIKQTTNYTVLDIIPIHSGYGQNIDFTNTFIEWNLICKSKKITTISVYDWGSGFTFFPSIIHNIPIENIIVPNI